MKLKQTKTLIPALAVSVMFFLAGCGGGGSSSSGGNPTNETRTVSLVIGKETKISQGDTLRRVSENADVKIAAYADTQERTVTLISGEAEIVKAP